MKKDDKKLAKAAMITIIAVFIFATFAPVLGDWRRVDVPAGKKAIYYLGPDNSSAPGFSQNVTVQVWVNSTIPFFGGKFTIITDASCGNIVSWTANTTFFDMQTPVISPDGSWMSMTYINSRYIEQPPGVYELGRFKIHCNSTTCCKTGLNFNVVYPNSYITNNSGDWCKAGGCHHPNTLELDNSTFTCGEPTEETYSKDLYEGWNLVSLPLTPSDNSASSVLASVWDNVSAVYKYDATSKQFESASTMDPGEGYFVHVTQNCTWTYSGTPYNSMSIELKKGLNMVGWLNCSEDISDALSSIEGDYWYVARWNAVSQSFEVYNPVAPSSFNDFTAMDRGTGYFISAKADTTLSASC